MNNTQKNTHPVYTELKKHERGLLHCLRERELKHAALLDVKNITDGLQE